MEGRLIVLLQLVLLKIGLRFLGALNWDEVGMRIMLMMNLWFTFERDINNSCRQIFLQFGGELQEDFQSIDEVLIHWDICWQINESMFGFTFDKNK